jgi:predicted dehydrogenase
MGTSLTRALLATDEATLAISYDVLPAAASKLAQEYGGRTAESAEALLSHSALDGVIIALPSYLHADAVVQAAEAGIDVLVEKPMALTIADCHRMLQAAKTHGTKLMVGQVLRYYEPYRSIRRWTADKRFGKLYAASIWRLSQGGGFIVAGHWRSKRAQSGGYLYEVSVHELDMLRCLMGSPTAIHAVSRKVLPRPHDVEDYVALQVQFDQGGVAFYEGGSSSHVGSYGFRFHFEEATLTSDRAFDPKALRIHGPGEVSPDTLESEFSAAHPVSEELRGWLSALRDEAPIPVPGEEGLATVALVEAAYRSAETNQITTCTCT